MKTRMLIHKDLCDEMHRLYLNKNADYGSSFQKVRAKIPNAILVRLNDKLNRLESLMGKDEEERKVKSESIDDTLMDIANYALLELVERRWDDQIDDAVENGVDEDEDEDEYEDNDENEDEDEEEDDELTFAESIKRISRRLRDMANKFVRSNTFDHPNYTHYEVFGSIRCHGDLHITVVRFDDNGEITGFKQEYLQTCSGGAYVDIRKDLITDPKMLNDNKICYHTIRNAVWNLMGQKRFQWIIIPNDDGFSYTFRSYIFDENNDLVYNFVDYHVVMDINKPLLIRDVKGMFEKEDEDAEKN